MTVWPVRSAAPQDLEPLSLLWHDGWHDAHGAITPAALVAQRLPDRFAKRLQDAGDLLRVAGPDAAPLGLCIIKGDHLDQLFVAPRMRGTGLAASLLQDGEDRLAHAGVTDALLDCAALNLRAAQFYARQGWTNLCQKLIWAEAADPPIQIEVILFGKRLTNGHAP